MADSILGSGHDPSCAICEYGRPSADAQRVLCKKKGVTSPSFSCKKFKYDPLKREPYRAPKLPVFDGSEFSLDADE